MADNYESQDVISEVDSLLENGLTVTEIAKRLNVSRKTIYKWLKNHDLQRQRFTNITYEQLRDEIISIKREHPAVGEIMLIGHLRRRNIVAPRQRIRRIIREIDAEGVRARRTTAIQRRTYYSPAPNYVWHMDGLHKLIRWKFVIHGAVDGYSRLIAFMKCSTNNKAETVFDHFIEAVEKYGMPLRVRTDHGGENQRVWELMKNHHQTEASVIVGSSVHNVRIERTWRDVNRLVCNHFREEFYTLESEGVLDPINVTDLICLREVYLPLINKQLEEHTEAHNHHRISSECNYTPDQLYSMNIHLLELHSNTELLAEGDSVTTNLDTSELPHVIVDNTATQLPDEVMAGLDRILRNRHIDVRTASHVYKELINYVGEALS